VVFVCENNQYAVSTPVGYASPIERVADRASAYGIAAETVDGNDVRAVYAAVRAAVERARAGEGPSLVEGLTYRIEGHYKGDPEIYRSKDEVQAWRENRDPLHIHRTHLITEGVLTSEEIDQIDEQIEAEIKAAVAFAVESPVPPLESLHEDLFAE
jgi:pyruvate dehydrogenase E1 component alpha subunit